MSVNIALVLACSLACSSVDGRRIVSVGNKDAVGDVGNAILKAANAKSSLQSDVKKADDAERAENDSDLDVNEADDAEHAESGFNVLESGSLGGVVENYDSTSNLKYSIIDDCRVLSTTFAVDQNEDPNTKKVSNIWHIHLETSKGVTTFTIDAEGRITSPDASNFDPVKFVSGSFFDSLKFKTNVWYNDWEDFENRHDDSNWTIVRGVTNLATAAGAALKQKNGHAWYGLTANDLQSMKRLSELSTGKYRDASIKDLLKAQKYSDDEVSTKAPVLSTWNPYYSVDHWRFPSGNGHQRTTQCVLELRKTTCASIVSTAPAFCGYPQRIMKPKEIECQDPYCTVDECCEDAGTCAKDQPECEEGAWGKGLPQVDRPRLEESKDEKTNKAWLPKADRPSFCSSKQCTKADCCVRPGKCSCPKGMKMKSGAAWSTKTNGAKYCRGLKCTLGECCDGTCQAVTCPAETQMRKRDASSISCIGRKCEEADCCDTKGSCASIPECPTGVFPSKTRLAYCAKTSCETVNDCCLDNSLEDSCKELVAGSQYSSSTTGCKCFSYFFKAQGEGCPNTRKFDPRPLAQKNLTCVCQSR